VDLNHNKDKILYQHEITTPTETQTRK